MTRKLKEDFQLDKAMEELENIERSFHQPAVDLAAAIDQHKQALELAGQISRYLDEAQTQLEQLDGSRLGTAELAKELE